MARKRASNLHYMGGIARHPGDSFPTAPRRDLDERDIARLSDEEYANVTGTPPFAEGSRWSGPLYSEQPPDELKADVKKQTEAEAKARKEAEKKAKAEEDAQQRTEAAAAAEEEARRQGAEPPVGEG